MQKGLGLPVVALAVITLGCGDDDSRNGQGGGTAGSSVETGGTGGAENAAGAGGYGGVDSGGNGGIGPGGTGGTDAGGSGGVDSGGNGGIGPGGAGGTDAGGSGGINSGGSGGTTAALCVNPDGRDPNVRGTTEGTDGAFTDECDSDGNLIEYYCEQEDILCNNPGPDGVLNCYQTGAVASTVVDCNGACVDGTCNSVCPELGDSLEYLAVDGGNQTATFYNPRAEAVYECDLVWDNDGDAYDCAGDPAVGLQITVTSLGLSGPCIFGEFGAFGSDDPAGPEAQECTYRCSIAQ